jgi:Got1/Sft2-like family
VPYIKHLVSAPRIPFTAAYFVSLGMTLYFAVGVCVPLGGATLIVAWVNILDTDFGDCAAPGLVKLLCVVCTWGDRRIKIRGKDGV